MLEFLGREPNDLSEYKCARCGIEFRIGYIDPEVQESYLEPNYCPVCGL